VREEQVRVEGVEPVGPGPNLGGRLLRADEQARRPGRGHGAERLEQQCALAHSGLAAEQRDRAGDQTATEDAVELGEAGRAARCAARVGLVDRDRLARDAGPRSGRSDAGYRRLLAEGSPLTAVGAAPHPLRRLVAARNAPIANTCSGHAGSVTPACATNAE